MAEKDRELHAISSIIELLKPLDALERSRVLEYVLKRLEMSAFQEYAIPTSESPDRFVGRAAAGHAVTDIRTLTAEKQPRSANEMVALIAYYLSELAAEDERATSVNVGLIRKYFKMAGFPMPRVPASALTNAAAAGYLENVSRGEYRLNPVGYNLVVHGLPRSSGPAHNNIARRQARKAKRKSSRR
jgi:hypothetical protein